MINKNEDIPIVFKKSEIRKIFRISARRLTFLIQRGDIRVVTLGNEVFIPRSEVERILGQDLRYVDLAGFGVRLSRGGKKIPVRESRIRKI